MSKLEELISELCPDGVEYKPLKEVTIKIIDGSHNPPKESLETNLYPMISAKNINNGKIDFNDARMLSKKDFTIENKRTQVQQGDLLLTIVGAIGRCAVVESNIKMVFQRSVCVIGIKPDLVVPRFLRYTLESNSVQHLIASNANGAAQKGIYLNQVEKIVVPIPPLPVQNEIVRILDSFTEVTEKLTAELAAELTARKKQYEYYRNNLLLFKNVQYYTLEEMCDVVDYRGKTPKKVDNGIFLITAKNIRKGYIDYDKSQEFIDPKDYDDVMHRGLPKIGDVLITTEAPCGNVAQVDRENIALAQRVIKYRPKTSALNSTFLKYLLLSNEFQKKLLSTATGGTVKGIKGSKLHKLTIPVPSIVEQERIVNILERFDALCNDISSGLPAEIEARKKQYEYYRDKLLTFKEAGSL